MLTLQEIVLKLTHFWEKQGCVIHFGHDLETGAGTFNPATFLRCLGPEPYATAYVEPSRRPADARFGQNPNRIQLFHQYQVILKPSPKDVQKLYLRSLAAIGLKLEKHDIRFVHDDWESPTLGAWGLGWEVWCDGMEISQFTYFQAMASLPLKPVSAEITYGLERLCMFIQNVDHILDIQWNESLTLGDISKQSEVEWATYNFSLSDPQMWLRHFDDYEKEAKRLVSQELPLPAYDFVVKASHAFNMLEARGVISVTERTRYIGRIRDLARLIATSYIDQREKKGFPLLNKIIQKPKRLLKIQSKFNPHTKRDFLLEIGSEELPATFVPIGMRHLKQSILNLLEKHRLSFEAVSVYGTPRRLAILVHKLAEGTAPKIVEKRGPSLAIAFDAEENWTPQGEAFLRSLNIPKSSLESIRAGRSKSLEIRQIKDTFYLFALVREEGQSTAHLLSSSLPSLIENLEFPKKMRWADLDITYARPVHWIVSLFGSTVIPFAFGDVIADRTTWGHSQLDCVKIALKHPSDYLPSLRDHYVIADVEERKKSILMQIEKLQSSHGYPLKQERVLSEVLFLAEYPQLAVASFDASFLRAPSEIVISEMVEHQKYFPVADEKGHLKNLCFITADNTPNDLIISGNQKVLSARLADGVFLYEQDAKTPLEELTANLKNVTFQKDLGSVFDKVERICKLSSLWYTFLKKGDPKIIQRIAFLCKADLSSSCVKEFPELQGVIGRYFALLQKEEVEVAEGIEEHWMPKGEGMPLPKTPGGTLVSLADKTDNLLGYYSVGLKPTSSSDPYGLRRQAIGMLRMLIEGKISIDLFSLFQEASSLFQTPPLEEIFLFITARAKSLFEDKGLAKDEIEASLSPMCINPYDQLCKAQALQSFRRTPDFSKLFEVYKRVRGQLNNPVSSSFRLELTTTTYEKSLASALSHMSSAWKQALLTKDYTQACSLLASLQDPLASLFENVKIMAEETSLRENRLALLKTVLDLFHSLADFSKLQTDV